LPDDEYVFAIDDHFYRNNTTAIICESLLPLTIEIYRKDAFGTAIEVSWKRGVDDKDTNPTETSISQFIEISEIMTNEILASIEGEDETYKFTIKLISELKFDALETRKKANYGADENSNIGYPTHPGLGSKSLPFKWIPTYGSDEIILKIKPSNSSIPNHDLNFYHFFNSYSVGNTQEPYGNFIQNTLFNDHIPSINYNRISVCNEETFIAHSNTTKVLHVDIVSLCETDDDTENYCLRDPSLLPDCVTPISSASHECINRGPDETLDLYYDVSKYQTLPESEMNDITRPVDSFPMNTQKRYDLKVLPSFKPSFLNPYFCNTPLPETKATPCDILESEELDKIATDLNTIYNQVGIEVVVRYTVLESNYDSEEDDGILSFNEQVSLHAMLKKTLRGEMAAFNKTQVWLTKLEGAAGRGSIPVGNNSLSVDLFYSNDRTIAHEIGHAKYELFHPDASSEYSDGKPTGAKDCGWESEDLLVAPVTNDIHNFMVSGFKFIGPDSSDPPVYRTDYTLFPDLFLIRPYHWNLIHTNH